MKIVPNRKIWFIFSGALIILSVLALGIWGLKPGIDFTGGSLLELHFAKDAPDAAELSNLLKGFSVEEVSIQSSSARDVVLRFAPIAETTHQDLVIKLKEKYGEVEEVRFDSIGPSVGRELFHKSLIAVLLVTAMIMLYIAWSFRHVTRPVPAWVYGGIVVVTFIHDVSIPLGLFSYLGHFKGWEVGSPFIAAVLTILGYSISDTIVVLDRVRENLRKLKGSFDEIVEASIHQSITRSVNTSMTTMLTLLAIFLFGGATLKAFSLALLVGISLGTYSSIFIAAPLLISWHNFKAKR